MNSPIIEPVPSCSEGLGYGLGFLTTMVAYMIHDVYTRDAHHAGDPAPELVISGPRSRLKIRETSPE